MSTYNHEFGEMVRAKLDELGWSSRMAWGQTGIDYGTVNNMARGQVPRKGVVIDFALGIGDDINRWLRLAGYPPIPPELVGPVDSSELPSISPLSLPQRKPRPNERRLLGVVESGLRGLYYLSADGRKEILNIVKKALSTEIRSSDEAAWSEASDDES